MTNFSLLPHAIIFSLFLSIGSWVTDCFEPALVQARHWHCTGEPASGFQDS